MRDLIAYLASHPSLIIGCALSAQGVIRSARDDTPGAERSLILAFLCFFVAPIADIRSAVLP
jgi:hypothetical protein